MGLINNSAFTAWANRVEYRVALPICIARYKVGKIIWLYFISVFQFSTVWDENTNWGRFEVLFYAEGVRGLNKWQLRKKHLFYILYSSHDHAFGADIYMIELNMFVQTKTWIQLQKNKWHTWRNWKVTERSKDIVFSHDLYFSYSNVNSRLMLWHSWFRLVQAGSSLMTLRLFLLCL